MENRARPIATPQVCGSQRLRQKWQSGARHPDSWSTETSRNQGLRAGEVAKTPLDHAEVRTTETKGSSLNLVNGLLREREEIVRRLILAGVGTDHHKGLFLGSGCRENSEPKLTSCCCGALGETECDAFPVQLRRFPASHLYRNDSIHTSINAAASSGRVKQARLSSPKCYLSKEMSEMRSPCAVETGTTSAALMAPPPPSQVAAIRIGRL